MSPFLYIHFFCAIVLAGSAVYLLSGNPGGNVNRTGFAALLFMSMWSFGTTFVQNPYVGADVAQGWDMVSFAGSTAATAIAPLFFRTYTQYKKRDTTIFLARGTVLLCLLVIAGSLHQHLTIFPLMTTTWYGWAKTVAYPMPLLAGLLTITLLALIQNVFYMYVFIKNADSTAVRRHGNRTLLVMSATFTIMIVLGIILPIFTVTIPDLSDLVSLIWAVAFPYWVQHYRLALAPGTTAASIIAAMPEALFLTDSHDRIISCNSAAQRMLGMSEADLNGKALSEFLVGSVEKHRNSQDTVAISPNGNESTNMHFLHRDTTRHIASVSFSPARNLNGEASGMIIIARDISERIAMEHTMREQSEALSRSNEELQAFAYIASHDLQEPLRKISAFGERLASKHSAALEEQGRDYLDRMRKAAQRMADLIDALLNYSRLNSQTLSPQNIDLNNLVSEVISDLEIRIQSLGGRVSAEPLPLIFADPVQMRQLVQNLIVNGLKYCRPCVPPVVEISSQIIAGSDGSKSVEITITDNGIGIEEKYYERIFGVFQRLHSKGEYEGTGVGLSICRKIVIRHNGSIRVRSVVGEGTSFIVSLPVMIKIPD